MLPKPDVTPITLQHYKYIHTHADKTIVPSLHH